MNNSNTKTKHINTVRETHLANRKAILQLDGMTEDLYNNLWLDSGIQFLKEMYPPVESRFKNLFNSVSNDTYFWQWWLSEWKREERIFIDRSINKGISVGRVNYVAHMLNAIHNELIETGFYENYLESKKMNFLNQKP